MKKVPWNIVLLLAVLGVLLWKSPPHGMMPMLQMVAIPLASMAFIFAYFIFVPALVIRKLQSTHGRLVAIYLECVTATPFPRAGFFKTGIRTSLANYYVANGRADRALKHAGACLRAIDDQSEPEEILAVKANLHRLMVDCYDALDMSAEAASEAAIALELIARCPPHFLREQTRGMLLDRENRHREAVAAYEVGLSLISNNERASRGTFLLSLQSSTFFAGENEACLKWANVAISEGDAGSLLVRSLVSAGNASFRLRRDEEADGYFQQALAVAGESQSPDLVGSAKMALANFRVYQGRLAEAESLCRECLTSQAITALSARMVVANVEAVRGKFDAAMSMFDEIAAFPRLPFRVFDNRVRATRAVNAARILLEQGRADEATAMARGARAVLPGDVIHAVTCDGLLVYSLAKEGDFEQSERVNTQLLERHCEYGHDPHSRLWVLQMLGSAAFVRGNFAESLQRWSEYLKSSPYPVQLPMGHWYLGESQLGLGMHAEARHNIQKAANCLPETWYSQLAKQRLTEVRDRNWQDLSSG